MANKVFHPPGPSWKKRAKNDELAAVIDPDGTWGKNSYIHAIQAAALGQQVEKLLPGFALDFGCGTGRMSRLLIAQGWQMLGVDITFEMLSKANELTVSPDALYVNMDGIHLPINSQAINLVVTVYTMQLIMRDEALFNTILNEISRVLKPGSRLMMIEIADQKELTREKYLHRLSTAGFELEHEKPLRLRSDRYLMLIERRGVPNRLIPMLGKLGSLECRWRFSRQYLPDQWDHLFVFKVKDWSINRG